MSGTADSKFKELVRSLAAITDIAEEMSVTDEHVFANTQFGYYSARINGSVTIDVTAVDDEGWQIIDLLREFAKGSGA